MHSWRCPGVSCCLSAKGGCPQGRARQEDGVSMAQPLQPNAQPSHSNGSETGKDTESLDLHSSNQSTHKHSTQLSWDSNLWLRRNISLGATAIPNWSQYFLSWLPTCPFCYTWVKDMYHGNLIKKGQDHTVCKWFSFVLELFGLEL